MDLASLAQISFHDSVITHLVLNPETAALQLDLELADQQDAIENQNAQARTGSLRYDGVTCLEIDPTDAISSWDSSTEGEILRLESEPVAQSRLRVMLVVVKSHYTTKQRETCAFKFDAESVSWTPKIT